MRRDGIPAELRNSLVDPVKLCHALGLAERAQKQARGLIIRCPVHGEKNPSCSVSVGPDGTIRVKCFACDFSGDALTLVAVAHGLTARSAFGEVLLAACRLAGRYDLENELSGESRPDAAPALRSAPQPEPEPAPDYPPAGEVADFWSSGLPVTEDTDTSGHLVGRRIDPELVARLDLARVIHRRMATDRLPVWARYRGVPWRDSGHRMLLQVFDAEGEPRSLRAWRVRAGETPKRLPPGGYRASGLVLANGPAVAMLRGQESPGRVVCVEGEPDFLVRSLVNASEAVLGILSGSWTAELAARIPFGSEVLVRTHNDPAGDRYAEQIIASIRGRALARRLAPVAPVLEVA